MIPANYHLHSTESYDGHAPVGEVCRAALAVGFTDIGFAEHLDFDREDPGYGHLDYARYRAATEEARREFAGRLAVRMGIEFDFRRAYGDEPRRVLDAMDLDYRIGSVHSAGGLQIWKLGTEEAADLAGFDLRAMQSEYFDEALALVETGWCHVLGHFDYLYKHRPEVFGPLRDEWYWGRVEAILAACIERGVALEVNSHHVEDVGLALAADEAILVRYRRLGGRLLAVGSDAHRPGDIAGGYGSLEAAVRAAGFTEVTGFEAGQPYGIPIG
jgi:histidinol-phosphatase (PHP family)